MNPLENAIAHVGSLDALAARDTAAARLDPRAKLAVTLLYVVAVASFGRTELARLAPLALYPAALAALGEVPLRPLALRLLLAAPFAAGVALFEPVLDRRAGWLAFATILAKFALSLSAALLLVATTGFDAVCAALGRLGAPRALVAQLLFTYRYLFVLGEQGGRLLRAHALRGGGVRPRLRTAGPLLGQLLLRTLDRAQRVHVAMRCRGFAGTLPLRRAGGLGRADVGFVAAAVAFLILARAVDLPGQLGAALAGVAGGHP